MPNQWSESQTGTTVYIVAVFLLLFQRNIRRQGRIFSDLHINVPSFSYTYPSVLSLIGLFHEMLEEFFSRVSYPLSLVISFSSILAFSNLTEKHVATN
jgi:hypothetical protein